MNKKHRNSEGSEVAPVQGVAPQSCNKQKVVAYEVIDGIKQPKFADAPEDHGEGLAVFVGGLTQWGCDEAALKSYFKECGAIRKIVIPKNTEGNAKGLAFITFKTKAGVESAIKLDGEDYHGRKLMVNMIRPLAKGKGKGKNQKDEGRSKWNNDLSVSVRGLPFSTTADNLKKDFAKCGELLRCKLLVADDGKCKGTAFIEYKQSEGFQKALELHETEYGGRTIYVSAAGDFAIGGRGKDGQGKNGKEKGKGKGKGTDKDNSKDDV